MDDAHGSLPEVWEVAYPSLSIIAIGKIRLPKVSGSPSARNVEIDRTNAPGDDVNERTDSWANSHKGEKAILRAALKVLHEHSAIIDGGDHVVPDPSFDVQKARLFIIEPGGKDLASKIARRKRIRLYGEPGAAIGYEWKFNFLGPEVVGVLIVYSDFPIVTDGCRYLQETIFERIRVLDAKGSRDHGGRSVEHSGDLPQLVRLDAAFPRH